MPYQHINQVLKDRKQHKRKVAHHREKRIRRKYQQEELPDAGQDPAAQRQKQFYEKVFNSKDPKPVKEKLVQPKQQQAQPQQKQKKLKNRKKQLIKKMKHQKTQKGQPLMRNYIKYALTKLQISMNDQKNAKRKNENHKKSSNQNNLTKQ